MERGIEASSRAGPSRKAHRAPTAAALLLAACGPELSPMSEVMAPIELQIRDSAAHDLVIEAPGSAPILITVAGRNVDVQAALIADGGPIVYCDAPNRRMGVETLLVQAPHAGRVTLRIQRNDHAGATGTAAIQAVALPATTKDDRLRLEAARQDAAGCLAFPDVLRADAAAAAYAAAAETWRALGHGREEGMARLHAAGVRYLRHADWAGSAELSAGAYHRLEAAVAPEHAAFALRLEGAALEALARSAEFDPRRQSATVQRARQRLTEAATRFDRLAMPYEAGYALSYRGVSLQEGGDFDRAHADFESSLQRFKAAGDEPAQAIALQNLAYSSMEEGRYSDAAAEFEHALELIPPLEDRANYAHTLQSSALPLPSLGRFNDAIARHHEAARILRELGDRDGEARALHSLGSVMIQIGEHERAAELLRAAVRLRSETGARREHALALLHLGDVERAAGRLDASIDLGLQALALVSAPQDRARVLLSLSRDHVQAASLAAARGRLDELLALPLPARHRYRGLAMVELAAIEAKLGQVESSESRFAQAIANQERAGLDLDYAGTLQRRAEARLERGELEPAIADSGLAVERFDAIGLQSLLAENRAQFRASYRRAVELRIMALLQAAQRAGAGAPAIAQRHLAAALDASDRARAQLLSDAPGSAAAGLSAELQAERRTVYEQIFRKRRQRDLLQEAADPQQETIATLSRDIELLRTRARLIDRQSARSQVRGPGDTDRRSAAPFAAVAPDTLVAEYFLGNTRSWLFEVRNGAITVHELGPRDRIERLARELHLAWRSLPRNPRDRLSQGTALARELFGPLGEELPPGGILIVPDGALHLVPLATLARLAWPVTAPGSAVVIPSVSSLLPPGSMRVPAPLTLAIVADPVYEDGDPRILPGARDTRTPHASALPEVFGQERLRRLPSTAIEARELAALVAEDDGVLSLTGPDASRARILAEPLERYRIVHFATHAIADSRDPALSTLALSSWSADGEPVPGALRVYDIAQMRFRAELVVLSGCETALGREIDGESPIGLSHAFLGSGARAVMATLWQVPDTATAALMRDFYRELLFGGNAPPVALARAQMRLRSQPRWADPFFWAGFQLVSIAPLEAGNNDDVAGREES